VALEYKAVEQTMRQFQQRKLHAVLHRHIFNPRQPFLQSSDISLITINFNSNQIFINGTKGSMVEMRLLALLALLVDFLEQGNGGNANFSNTKLSPFSDFSQGMG